MSMLFYYEITKIAIDFKGKGCQIKYNKDVLNVYKFKFFKKI